MHHQAARGDVGGLLVLGIDADIADMREGEGDDLPGIGGVGQGLLVAGDPGAEADLADPRPRLATLDRGVRAEAAAPQQRAVRQHQGRTRTGRSRLGALRREPGLDGGLQIGELQPGRAYDRGPMLGRDHARLSPLAHRLGADAGKARSLLRATEPVDDRLDADSHDTIPARLTDAARSNPTPIWGRKFPKHGAGDTCPP